MADAQKVTSFAQAQQSKQRLRPAGSEVAALETLLLGRLPSNKAAAQQFAAHTAQHSVPANTLDPELWATWSPLADAARQFPQRHSDLIDLTVELPRQPDVPSSDSENASSLVAVFSQVLWRDLPLLWETWAENVFSVPYPSPSDPNYDHAYKQVINVFAFTTKLVTHPASPVRFSPVLLRCLPHLTLALEESPWTRIAPIANTKLHAKHSCGPWLDKDVSRLRHSGLSTVGRRSGKAVLALGSIGKRIPSGRIMRGGLVMSTGWSSGIGREGSG